MRDCFLKLNFKSFVVQKKAKVAGLIGCYTLQIRLLIFKTDQCGFTLKRWAENRLTIWNFELTRINCDALISVWYFRYLKQFESTSIKVTFLKNFLPATVWKWKAELVAVFSLITYSVCNCAHYYTHKQTNKKTGVYPYYSDGSYWW